MILTKSKSNAAAYSGKPNATPILPLAGYVIYARA